jgi:hypothetical protein
MAGLGFECSIEAMEEQPLGPPHAVQFVGHGETPEAAMREAKEMAVRGRGGKIGKPRITRERPRLPNEQNPPASEGAPGEAGISGALDDAADPGQDPRRGMNDFY